jgi:hypothetical protein
LKSCLLIFILAIWVHSASEAQYITEVMEYTPAPGQLINTAPWGTPDGARSIEGSVDGSICLGAFGGYVIFRFEDPVENDPSNPFGIDFTIFGNPVADWAEPGVVWVMKDENGNGKADDTWYELAGSDYLFNSTQRGQRVTYHNPGGDEAQDILWEDIMGDSGWIRTNSAHTQPYYPLADSFPSIPQEMYQLNGSQIKGLVFEHPSGMKSIERAFGYADNHLRGSAPYTLPDNPYTRQVENSGGDAFDIGWAVDSAGHYVALDRIHFIKVQCGILDDGGILGELSTEITGALDVPPDPSVSGETEMVVIRDLPPLLEAGEYKMEVFIYDNGRIREDGSVNWTTSGSGATVDDHQMLKVTEEGPLTVTATLTDRPEISASVSTLVQLNQTGGLLRDISGDKLLPYPNPFTDYFKVHGTRNSSLIVYDASGKALIRMDHCLEETTLDMSGYPAGIYLVRIAEDDSVGWYKMIKL